jgi:hypothetical protein
MSKKITTSYTGLSFLQVLTIVFVALKLTNVINWSWWFVLMPLWLPITIFLSIMFFVLVSVFLIKAIKD